MKVAVYCGKVPTEKQCAAIYALMVRTMKKINKPFFSHALWLSGPAKEKTLVALSHAGLNVAMRKPTFMLKYAVVIGGPAHIDFIADRKQVLICPVN